MVSTRHYPDAQCVIIAIADNGGGILAKVQARIFEPFFTTKEVGVGTGQGLAIAHNVIVKSHQGQMGLIARREWEQPLHQITHGSDKYGAVIKRTLTLQSGWGSFARSLHFMLLFFYRRMWGEGIDAESCRENKAQNFLPCKILFKLTFKTLLNKLAKEESLVLIESGEFFHG